jgi:hypothetical protein
MWVRCLVVILTLAVTFIRSARDQAPISPEIKPRPALRSRTPQDIECKAPRTIAQVAGALLVPRRVQSLGPATGKPGVLSGLLRMPRLGPSFNVPMDSVRSTAPTGLIPRLVQRSVESADAATAETASRESSLLSKTATLAAMPVVAARRTATSGMDMMVASADRIV